MTWLWYVIIGFVSGIISGMGIGGGTVLIPALDIFMNVEQQTAQNINLIYFIPTAVFALFIHRKKGNIEKKTLPAIIFWGLAGAVLGSLIAVRLGGDLLRKLFGIFLLVMGVNEFFKKKTEERSQHGNH